MKDRKLLIPIRCTTREFYLHKPRAGRNDWHEIRRNPRRTAAPADSEVPLRPDSWIAGTGIHGGHAGSDRVSDVRRRL